jgi:WhiB family redox-sensing transcriptional regulator
MFYHPDGERGRARAQRENRAKAICHTCPVIAACREHALKVAEPYGIWGGLSESERLSVLRNRGTRPGRQKVRVAAAPSRPTVNA